MQNKWYFNGDAIDLRRGRWASDRQVHDAKDQLTPGQLEELNDNIKVLGGTGCAWHQLPSYPVTLWLSKIANWKTMHVE